jgi:hypothetical protein
MTIYMQYYRMYNTYQKSFYDVMVMLSIDWRPMVQYDSTILLQNDFKTICSLAHIRLMFLNTCA